MHRVIVSNVGMVVETASHEEARRTYFNYVRLSNRQYGRTAGENVTWVHGEEIIKEHQGTLEKDEAHDEILAKAHDEALAPIEFVPEPEPKGPSVLVKKLNLGSGVWITPTFTDVVLAFWKEFLITILVWNVSLFVVLALLFHFFPF